MPDTLEAPAQAIAAETASNDQSNLSDGASFSATSEALILARMTHAPAAEITRLEAQMQRHAQASQKAAELPAATDDTQATYWGADEPLAPVQELPKAGETKPTDAAGDTPQTEDETKVSDRLRINHLNESDKVLQNAVTLMTRGGMSLQEAYGRVFGQPEVSQAAPAIPEAAPTEITTLEAQLAELDTKLDEAGATDGFFNPEVAKLTKEFARLSAKLEMAKLAEIGNTEKRTSLDEAKHLVRSDVAKTWPDIGNPETPLYMLARGVSQGVWNNPAHPKHRLAQQAEGNAKMHGEFVTYCAEEAAKMLGMAAPERTDPTARAPIAVQAVVAAAVRQPGPASGSRATAPPSPQKSVQQAREESAARLNAMLTGQSALPRHTGSGGVVILR